VKLQEARIEVRQRGKGKPLLLLHGEDHYEDSAPFVDELARSYRVIMPWMPGFAGSTLPDSVRNVEDISYLYLDMLDRMNLKDVAILGFSVGGWIATEMATKNCSRLRRLALVAPVGIKVGGPYDRDIEDIYFHSFARVQQMKFHDVSKDPRVLTEMSDQEALFEAQAREATAKLCWEPYFHNPSLRYRLNRVTVKTLVMWGAQDGFVKPAYGRAYAKRMPNAKFVSIPKAGHFPHIEQPDAFMKELRAFLR
jgi:pimeloyl-ACP methyl ester carboxylesterase